ncbi:MAG TPA: prolipoprotein diacylglyceryl transferase family protein, partial [Polyangiaceae bacterium]|nr:prolipoprotein diacylglyceryl transferase family protein [Polyangiaceae bacterium]
MHPLLFRISLEPTSVRVPGRAFSLGAFDVQSFGALLALGLLVAAFLTVRAGARRGLDREALLAALVAAFFGGLFGARLGFVLLHPASAGSFAEALTPRGPGLSLPFALAGGALGLGLVARRRGLPLAPVFDAAAPGF